MGGGKYKVKPTTRRKISGLKLTNNDLAVRQLARNDALSGTDLPMANSKSCRVAIVRYLDEDCLIVVTNPEKNKPTR